MADKIRRIKEDDFQEVSALYNYRKSVEELKWLYKDPENPLKYNAFVAVNEQHNIIGAIAYSLSTYIQDGEEVHGIIPMNWKITTDYKGMAGVLLFKKVLSLGDYGIAIAGSDTAQNLYSLFKYSHITNIDHFYKILNITKTLKYYKRKSLAKSLGMIGYLLPSYFRNTSKLFIYQNVKLIKYEENNSIDTKKYDGVFRKQITKNYIDWLLACPSLETYAFNIKKGNNSLGICVLYIQKIKSVNHGRIVHLPFLGNDKKLWACVVYKCLAFFKKEKCCIVDSLALNKTHHQGLSEAGFLKIKKHSKPLFIKDDTNKLDTFNLKNWYLQYTEGDKAYRDL